MQLGARWRQAHHIALIPGRPCRPLHPLWGRNLTCEKQNISIVDYSWTSKWSKFFTFVIFFSVACQIVFPGGKSFSCTTNRGLISELPEVSRIFSLNNLQYCDWVTMLRWGFLTQDWKQLWVAGSSGIQVESSVFHQTFPTCGWKPHGMMLDAHLQCSSAFLHASASSQGGFNPSQDGQDRIEKMKPPLYQTRWHRHKNENQTTNQIHWHSLVVIYPWFVSTPNYTRFVVGKNTCLFD